MLPILYQNHNLIIYAYPMLMGIGWGIAYQIFFSLLGENVSRLNGQAIFWGIFLAAWVGAKVFFYLTVPKNNNFLSEINFWTGGGFVFYGGLLGAIAYLGVYRLFDKKLALTSFWPLLPALAFGHGIGRVGCFLAGCCYGKPTEFMWGVFLHGEYRHPTQLIEALGLSLLGLYLIRSKAQKITLFTNYLVIYGGLRIVIEALRGDEIRGAWLNQPPSLWVSLMLLLVGLILKFSKKNDPLCEWP